MKDSYLSYAMSVIVSRALPDARDGLKPSQRRILVAMNDLNLGPRSKFRKCAKIAGDTVGNYHPHGDQVVYPTLVRLAQDFNTRYLLIQGQGNFGSIDGDPAAAMRYTEARLTLPSVDMLDDVTLETVDFISNYDETRKEPTVLPCKFPNLLCNGSSGIAVGMTTNVPPHNAREILDGIIKIIDDPDVDAKGLMKIVKGPDFPTGGTICGRKGIHDAYTTGRGSITVRARCFTENTRGGKKNIIITEIPYQLNKTNLIEKIADLVKSGKITGIADIRDESDRDGMRLVIDLKRGEEEEVILNQLYKYTQLQTTYGIIMLALVDSRPEVMSLRQMMEQFKLHRVDVIRRRTAFLLKKAEARAHVLEGYQVALKNIDEVIETIKKAKDTPTAQTNLMKKFKLTEIQADAILKMQLQRLTGLEKQKIEDEYKEIMAKIKEYRAILADEKLVLAMIKEDCVELKKKYTDPRRTEIVGAVEGLDIEDLIAEEDMAVTISHENYIKRIPLSTYRRQGRGGQGVTGAQTKEGDFVEQMFIASTHDYLLFFTNLGRIYWQKVYDIPQMSRTAKGRAVVNLLQLRADEKVQSTIAVRNFDDRNLVMATQKGVIKKSALKLYSHPKRGGIIAVKLDAGDKLIGVRLTTGNEEIILATECGQAIRFNETDVRSMGRSTRGVGGIGLRKDDKVCDVAIVDANGSLLTVCQNGFGKRTPFEEYRIQRRNGSGIINVQTSDRNGRVIGVKTVRDGDELMLMSAGGMIVRIAIDTLRNIGRNTQGVRLVKLKEGDRLVSIARVVSEGEGENGDTEDVATESAPTDEAQE